MCGTCCTCLWVMPSAICGVSGKPAFSREHSPRLWGVAPDRPLGCAGKRLFLTPEQHVSRGRPQMAALRAVSSARPQRQPNNRAPPTAHPKPTTCHPTQTQRSLAAPTDKTSDGIDPPNHQHQTTTEIGGGGGGGILGLPQDWSTHPPTHPDPPLLPQ